MNPFSAALYNSLYSIDVANKLFADREAILAKLAPLFSKKDEKFGVCLAHRHCFLEDGEIMVAKGNISQPEREVKCYPERWLSTGEAYEFSAKPTYSPPQELLGDFRKIIGEANLNVLGLFFIGENKMEGVAVERTKGRRNIIDVVPYLSPRRALTTAWLPGKSSTSGDGVMVKLYECSACSITNNSHIENVEKMEGLEWRRDLGHEIEWLRSDTRQGVRIV